MPSNQAWFEDTKARRIILAEIGYYDVIAATEKTMYLGTVGYVTSDASIVFEADLKADLKFGETISQSGGASMSYGTLVINNATGAYDKYLDGTKYIWSNRPISLYYGDPSFVCTDIASIRTNFATIFNGITDDIDSSGKSIINLKLRDKMERLNAPLTEAKLGTTGVWAGGQTNQDTIKPIIFGEVFNMTPLLVDPSILKYMFCDGGCEKVIEIRDNGVPVYTDAGTLTGAVVDTATGTFTLASPAVGAITVSAQGLKNSLNLTTGSATGTYTNSIAGIIGYIVRFYGKANTQLAITDIDLTNFSAFNSTNTSSIGLVITDRENVINVCNNIASSVGAQLIFTRTGLLQLQKWGTTSSVTSVTVVEGDFYQNSFEVSSRTPVVGAIKLGYCKNWTVQASLATAIPDSHKQIYAEEWLTVTQTDSTVVTNYKLTVDPDQIDSLLINTTNANTIATNRLNLVKNQRMIYKFRGSSKLLTLQLGQPVVVITSRFNLFNSGSGTSGQVVSLAPDWGKGTVDIEVLI